MSPAMSDTPELLPCPLCGGPSELWRAHPENPKLPAWVACMDKCVVLISHHYEADAEAIAAWNRRSPSAAYAAGAAKMRERALKAIPAVEDDEMRFLYDDISALPLPPFDHEVAVEKMARAIEERMGPLVGHPEYLADPIKRGHAEKRRKDAALGHARAALAALIGEK